MSQVIATMCQPINAAVLQAGVETKQAMRPQIVLKESAHQPTASSLPVVVQPLPQSCDSYRSINSVQPTVFLRPAIYNRLQRELKHSLVCGFGFCGIAHQLNLLSVESVTMFLLGELIATCMALRIVRAFKQLN